MVDIMKLEVIYLKVIKRDYLETLINVMGTPDINKLHEKYLNEGSEVIDLKDWLNN